MENITPDGEALLREYKRAKELYGELVGEDFPSALGAKGSALHTRRSNRLQRADRALYDAGLGHLR
ncbi:MAG: hypothetical protein F4Z53_14500 [Acidimicrobiales bacterium]|nr:hypothetical protein [Acidimicrobiales bacterium]MYD35118.1 hypothetical protein [Acidimicrobiales bacterium]MYI08136.1 hypothetical protein [Acidimicrobiales bacterium]